MTTDVVKGLDLIAVLCPDTDQADVLIIEGEPKSKARPRMGNRGTFYSPSEVEETALAWKIKSKRITKRLGRVAVGVIFYRSGFQRMDVDNMLKLVLDAGTAAKLWDDDHQVTALLGVVEYDPEHPRTVIALGDHVTTFIKPTFTCPRCGKDSPLYTSAGHRRVYCSRECRYAAIKLIKNHPGQGRGRKHQPPASCVDCGRILVKRSFVRCRPCWVLARKKGVA